MRPQRQNQSRINLKSTFFHILIVAGVSLICSGIFMLYYFGFEKAGITPYLTVSYMENFSEAENMVLFTWVVIGGFFISFFVIYLFYRITGRN